MFKKLLFRIHYLKYRILRAKAYYYSFLFKSCGVRFRIWGGCNIKNPQNIEIGDDVSINDGAYINGLGGVFIGANVSISAQAIIVSTSLVPESFPAKVHCVKPIIIGSNVQIGAGSILLPGVNIGNNVMIGAGSVVTKDVGENMVVAGNPARVLRAILD